MHEFEQAKDKVMMGAERRSMVMTEDEKRLTAYHEGGHAIIAYYTPNTDPIHKATIIPRGQALGMVMRLPESDRFSESRNHLLGIIKVCMGGRIAEELIFGYDNVTTGASSDIRTATKIARAMVTECGLSDRLWISSLWRTSTGSLSGSLCCSKQNPSLKQLLKLWMRKLAKFWMLATTKQKSS